MGWEGPAYADVTIARVSYPYEDLDDKQFERIVVQAMRKLFGAAVQAFAAGPDGGRDARFDGTAERFPSAADPWVGVTIGQAKHTVATNAHFSDPGFGGDSDSSVISEELPRIKGLVESGELDHYILFANRRLGGTAGPALVTRISKATGLPETDVYLVGVERLNDLLHEHPKILELAKIDPIDGPLLPSSYELAEVVLAISKELGSGPATESARVVDRVSFDEKNELNSMSTEFADQLAERYLKDSKRIEDFLADPSNAEHLEQYQGATEDFQLKIVAKRKDYQSFDDVFNRLVEVLIKQDGILAGKAHLARSMLFYMYWHCDIGVTADDQTE